MSHAILETESAQQCRSFLAANKRLWLPPTVLCGAAALLYALLMTRMWEASQAVVVRQGAAASTEHPGKFADLYEMRTLQETILELARSRQVIAATLETVDGSAPGSTTPDDVEEFRDRLRMAPPGGAEFGKTEVFYLSLKDPSRKRALALVGELCRQLEIRLQELRADQAQGLIAELKGQLEAAKKLHEAQTARLAEFESDVGADLGELRLLHSAFSGQSDLRQQYVALETESRNYKAQVRETEQLLQLLVASQADPSQLAALPSSLLTAQPALRRLKDGLVDAQLQTSRIQGTRSAEHPLVLAALESEASIRRDLTKEMRSAQEAAEAELKLGRSRYAAAQQQLQAVETRLTELAERRAEYTNRVAALESSRRSMDEVRRQLVAAQATEASADVARVLTMVDQPETGPSPGGPSRAMTVLAGILGGFTLGLGLIFYPRLAPAEESPAAATPVEQTEKNDMPSTPPAAASKENNEPEWWELESTPLRRPDGGETRLSGGQLEPKTPQSCVATPTTPIPRFETPSIESAIQPKPEQRSEAPAEADTAPELQRASEPELYGPEREREIAPEPIIPESIDDKPVAIELAAREETGVEEATRDEEEIVADEVSGEEANADEITPEGAIPDEDDQSHSKEESLDELPERTPMLTTPIEPMTVRDDFRDSQEWHDAVRSAFSPSD